MQIYFETTLRNVDLFQKCVIIWILANLTYERVQNIIPTNILFICSILGRNVHIEMRYDKMLLTILQGHICIYMCPTMHIILDKSGFAAALLRLEPDKSYSYTGIFFVGSVDTMTRHEHFVSESGGSQILFVWCVLYSQILCVLNKIAGILKTTFKSWFSVITIILLWFEFHFLGVQMTIS